jgi:hypothetical protein
MTSPLRTPPTRQDLPVLTEVLMAGTSPQPAPTEAQAVGPTAQASALAAAPLDTHALEVRLLEHLTLSLQQQLQQRVHAAVVPAVAVLAERIAHKAAQEVANDLVQRMQDDLRQAVHTAVLEALRRG